MTLAYGIYLMHGGNPDNFADMTEDDILTIYVTNDILEKQRMNRVIELIKDMMGK